MGRANRGQCALLCGKNPQCTWASHNKEMPVSQYCVGAKEFGFPGLVTEQGCEDVETISAAAFLEHRLMALEG